MGWLDAVGTWAKANPYALQGLSSTLGNVGAGMVGHGNDARDLVRGITGAVQQGQGAQGQMLLAQQNQQADQAAIEAEKVQQNLTRQRLAEWGYDDLVAAMDGGYDPREVWGEALKRRSPQTAEGPRSYGTPIWGTDTRTNTAGFGVMDDAGDFNIVDTGPLNVGKEPIRLDAGDRFILLDPVTRNKIGEIPKSGDIPTAFEPQPDGSGIQPMEGSEPAIDRQGEQIKASAAYENYSAKLTNVVGVIDQAINQSGFSNTGVLGVLGTVFPGFWGTDLQKRLNTIAAYSGFGELQAMRDASPTGGALGQVTERELELLQSVVTSVAQSQSEQQLDENLKALRDFLVASSRRVRAAYQADMARFGPAAMPAFGGAGGGTPDLSTMSDDDLLRSLGM